MSTFPATEQLKQNGTPVYIHKPCLGAITWGKTEEQEYGPIDMQGCDRCESAPDGQWTAIRVAL